jgi:hypothetical protein
VSCFCGQTHISLASALACPSVLQGSRSPRAGNNTQTVGVRSVSQHHDNMSLREIRATSRLMGRRISPVGEVARVRAQLSGQGLLRTTLRGGRPPLSLEERLRRRRERKRRERDAKKRLSPR